MSRGVRPQTSVDLSVILCDALDMEPNDLLDDKQEDFLESFYRSSWRENQENDYEVRGSWGNPRTQPTQSSSKEQMDRHEKRRTT